MIRVLLLHSSSPAVVPGHRRVFHFDFAVGELAGDLKWAAGFGLTFPLIAQSAIKGALKR